MFWEIPSSFKTTSKKCKCCRSCSPKRLNFFLIYTDLWIPTMHYHRSSNTSLKRWRRLWSQIRKSLKNIERRSISINLHLTWGRKRINWVLLWNKINRWCWFLWRRRLLLSTCEKCWKSEFTNTTDRVMLLIHLEFSLDAKMSFASPVKLMSMIKEKRTSIRISTRLLP